MEKWHILTFQQSVCVPKSKLIITERVLLVAQNDAVSGSLEVGQLNLVQFFFVDGAEVLCLSSLILTFLLFCSLFFLLFRGGPLPLLNPGRFALSISLTFTQSFYDGRSHLSKVPVARFFGLLVKYETIKIGLQAFAREQFFSICQGPNGIQELSLVSFVLALNYKVYI